MSKEQGCYRGFQGGSWQEGIDVRDFIQSNVNPYTGDASFLAEPTERTRSLWERCRTLLTEETRRGGVYEIDTHQITGITAFKPGYIDRKLEIITGLQTDEPLKRAVNPFGGIRMAVKACQQYGVELDPGIVEVFTKYRTTHNEGVFRAYTGEILRLRHHGIITGLPDAYGRGRIMGDYRRVALYGVNHLLAAKEEDLKAPDLLVITEETIRLREEVRLQLRALRELKEMAAAYGYDLGRPAENGREAVQWLYFAYLAAIKEQNGAAMSLGRVSTFLDIYLERDLAEGKLEESGAQELIDDFVIKLRLTRQLRTKEYYELFAGDPNWVTESVGGMTTDGRTLVTKTSFRMLQTLYNMGSAPEPNLTVLWSVDLPRGFKEFCAKLSADTCSLQYENDDLMRPIFGCDYGIACCVSAMRLGRQTQYFGARSNLAKCLLLTLNGGREEFSGEKIAPEVFQAGDGPLDFHKVWPAFQKMAAWLAERYVATMNIIHYMHDRYFYEDLEMALLDTRADRLMAFGLAGLSVVADSLSAIKFAQVEPVFDHRRLITGFNITGDYPKYGNNDNRVDDLAVEVVKLFDAELKKHRTYRNAKHTLSILTITSNVVYGKKTGSTPDGRKSGEPFAPGANPMHGRDTKGALAALSSVAKIPYEHALDGISYTFSITPGALGRTPEDQVNNLMALLDGYFMKGGHHLNVNVFDRELLLDAMDHPEKYPQLTVRVSGYAVNFVKLTREQQEEIISRTIFAREAGL
ncbi:Formate acetyltransferase [Pelotomaculum sp. FP]|uniref:formate C-acetyltransferase n=1 Tax=Pelotomaculum sp. FP TaxID=261474 RepID=UPI001064920A|nr:formate C-acetyltransferase [Pelotomaculum sp. FP]TEB16679.1 Formate acetyltransferase [Pelotomaculum sp. FP]